MCATLPIAIAYRPKVIVGPRVAFRRNTIPTACADRASIEAWKGRESPHMADTEDTLFPPAADNLDQSPNWLVGVIDEPARAEQAAQALLDAGFSPDDVLLLHGPEAIRRLE